MTAEETDKSDLLGSWQLEITDCSYAISVDGFEQGAGRVELVEGGADAGRVALSEDFGCSNEFMGAGFYEFTFDGSSLVFEEAIAATDQCEGRAEAFVGVPPWRRLP